MAMTIQRLLEDQAFGPDEIETLTIALEQALGALGLADRSDAVTEIVARRIIEFAHRGERDPGRLSERALQSISVPDGPAQPTMIFSPTLFG
jgi:hypothetical protein